MKRPWAALVLVLALSVIMPRIATAQSNSKSKSGVTLHQNYPNPFNPETTIPFDVGGYPTCNDQGRQHRVTMKIYNIISQLVATPVLKGGSGGGGGAPLEKTVLLCGKYEGFWDGKDRNTGREAGSGIYTVLLDVDGVVLSRKMIVAK